MRFTIAKKLTLFNLILLIFMVLVGLFGINGMVKINQVNKKLDDTWIPVIQETHSITYNFMRLAMLQSDLLMAGNDEQKAAIKKEMGEVVEGLKKDVEEFKTISTGSEHEAAFQKVETMFNQYIGVHENMMAAYEKNNQQETTTYYQQTRDLFWPVNNELYALVLLNNENMNETSSGSMTAFKAGTTQTYVMIGISIVLSVLAIFYLIKLIAKPVRQLSEVAEDVANGNLVQNVKMKSDDEIGDLAKSIQAMCMNLQTLISNINKESQEVSSFAHEFTVSASEVTDGGEQIAITMGELAKGAEEQASSTTSLSGMMKEFSSSIQRSSENGEELNEEAKEIRELTDNGFNEMEQTKEQIEDINKVVQESVEKVMRLDRNYQ
ncbi:methyl-accepting chemotaxis protein, partial [Metabacillus fastidiosus]